MNITSSISKKIREEGMDSLLPSSIMISTLLSNKIIEKSKVISTINEIESLDDKSDNDNNNIIIGTHDGTFHCDEALAIGLLKVLPRYRESTILRTRNGNELAKCSIVVDVGAEYDNERKRYDHHQKTFDGTFRGDENNNDNNGKGSKIKLSSAGLI